MVFLANPQERENMAFTGELEQLHIVDIIQLLNTTRKSGTLSVKGSKGESRIIFSNGYIVGANHLDGKVRIGTVLVKMNAITRADLENALKVQTNSGKDRKPLIATLIALGKLGHEEASGCLKKLIDLTIGEMISWTSGTFTLDTDAITVSSGCSYPISMMEQEVCLDAQMILMDALRLYDERERDLQSGKVVASEEDSFLDVIPSGLNENRELSAIITADDLGLGNLDLLERKMPEYISPAEIFDPFQIHRHKVRETLAGFPAEDQEVFVSFLEKSRKSVALHDTSQRQDRSAKGLILFSEDELIKHSVMTICKDEGVLVFATDGEEELERITEQCLAMKIQPVLVFDISEAPDSFITVEKVISLRQALKRRYPGVPIIQIAPAADYSFMLQSFHDGIRAVFPKPSKISGKAGFVPDTILFLETFNSYTSGLFLEQKSANAENKSLSSLKNSLMRFNGLNGPSSVSVALLQYVSDLCPRSLNLIVRQSELVGEKAIGVYSKKSEGPVSADSIIIPLTTPSVFRKVAEEGQVFYGKSNDEVLKKYLHEKIGTPLSPVIILIPMKRSGRTVSLTYGDFGGDEALPLQSDLMEIIAHHAGLVLENSIFRKKIGIN
jgi:hypothetical protein